MSFTISYLANINFICERLWGSCLILVTEYGVIRYWTYLTCFLLLDQDWLEDQDFLKWDCIGYLSIDGVLRTVDVSRDSPSLEKQAGIQHGS